MGMEQELFARHTAHTDKLAAFGFVKNGKDYFYKKFFHGGDFWAEICVHPDSSVTGHVIDASTGAEYAALHVEGAAGPFVGAVREEYKQILTKILCACFTRNPFLFPQSNRIALAIADKYQEYPDYPFENLPHYGVFRYPRNRKWYGLVMNIPKYRLLKEKKEPKDETAVEILNLKAGASQAWKLIKTKGFYPCYHMSRANWISILLDGSVPDKTILELLEKSRNYAVRASFRPMGNAATSWIVPANPKYFDLDNAFAQDDTILWKQSSTVQSGDVVYLYVAAPVSAIRYKCKVLEAGIPYEYKDKNVSMTHVMKIKRLKTYAPDICPFAKLKTLGIAAVRGPRLAAAQFLKYIEK
ncbi:MAG: MmcQ/YjbR family DNA-binding protein [Elusimicrobiales bacterium]|nr:MmcQ/YjbR family DNA-binding protein [Elusimicrobiales bacterium]